MSRDGPQAWPRIGLARILLRGTGMSQRSLVPQLIESTGPHKGRAHALPYGDHIIGRGSEASIQLDDKDVSRRHARLEVGPEGVIIYDLGSKNGIFAAGEKVNGAAKVLHGDMIAFGDLRLTVRHPASQVSNVLAAAGETTATRTRTNDDERHPLALLWPLLGITLFGGLVATMLLM